MKLDKIKKLIEMVEASEINEITIEENGTRISIRKGVALEQVGENAGLIETETTSEDAKNTYPGHWKSIEAPMVGTFYRAPTPDANPFIEEGDLVEEGQTVCILEAMKLMNEITAEEKGVIKRVLVENGHSVEYGQDILLYEPV
jgi:acetyl-CoA carboxylase biotin carboxyl carrier protein